MQYHAIASLVAFSLSPALLSAQSDDAEQAAREAAFAKRMSRCKMVGRFTVDGNDGPPRPETYLIEKATKLRDEKWKFDATIRYDGKDVTLPVGANVLWAGDTPTIQVTDVGFPMLGTYSARVVFHGDRYAGVWSGKSYGGHMFGHLERMPAKAAETQQDPVPQAATTQQGGSKNWAFWRGPEGSGAAPGTTPPLTWSENENVRWKVDVPGLGHATPIVWGDHIILTTAIETDEDGEAPELEPIGDGAGRGGRGGRRGRRPPEPLTKVFDFRVMALDRKDGSTAWSTSVARTVPHERGHSTGSQASGSPITDGERIYTHFGSRGIHCLDMKGEVLWSKDYGYMRTRNQFGEGSSPAIWGDIVVINWDHEKQSFIAALDKRTGKELWKQDRDEVTSWSTPVITKVDGKPQIIINATTASRGYDLQTGKVIWELGGMTVNTIPTPIIRDDVAFLMSGFRGAMLQAVALPGARGDLTDSEHVLWQHTRATSYVPSALLYGDDIYFLRVNNAVLTCVDAKTGEVHYEGQRLGGLRTVYASPVGANGHVYVTSREGQTKVFKAGHTFEEVATNELADAFDASAVILGDAIYLRGHKSLYCLSEK